MRFGRTPRPAVNGRHRTPGRQDPEQLGADLAPDPELETYLAALAPVRDPELTDPGRGFGSAQVHQLRLPAGADERVQRLAQRHGTSPVALIQQWVLQRLELELGRPAPRR
ncbi:MAG: hypothetical protein ACRDT0_13740 [Pseudonocardiaceae bacterium]